MVIRLKMENETLRRFLATALAVLAFTMGTVTATDALARPSLPGAARMLSSEMHAVQAGQVLTTELRCGRCHAGRMAVGPDAPPMDGVFTRVSPTYLRNFLLSPQSQKPGTTMPDVLATLPAGHRSQVVDELLAYLQTRSGQMTVEQQQGDFNDRDEGEKIFRSIGCVACHGTSETVGLNKGEAFVPLGALGSKTTVGQLSHFLLDPAAVRPGTRMPNFRLNQWQAKALATYLLQEQLPRTEAEAKKLRRPGVTYEYFEGFVREGPPQWEKMKLVRRGVVPTFVIPEEVRGTKMAVRYSALLEVTKAGAYTFYAESNDGSELVIDRKLVVKNHGFHGKVEVSGKLEMSVGTHVVDLSFWQDEGNKSLHIAWEGPNFKKQDIPAKSLFGVGTLPMVPVGYSTFATNADKATKGAAHFASLGCASCHDKAQANDGPISAADIGKGCLSPMPTGKAMNYFLGEDQRSAIGDYLKSPASKQNAKSKALVELATNNCLACHERDGLGGPGETVGPMFTQTVEVDLGEEGRMPPTLTAAGAKLRPEAIRGIVGHAELHVRPYMAVRMPTFNDGLAQSLSRVLASADGRDRREFNPASANVFASGRRLLGSSSNPEHTGFGCVNCHSVAGNAGQGTPGPDLALAPSRLNFQWFDKWLASPQSIRPDTRMPTFWGDEPLLTDVQGGVPSLQRAAIWAYLKRGTTPLPEGLLLQSAAQEMEVGNEPIVYRTFMKDSGPRAIVVGNPESVHVAFDANVVRMAQAWRGRFWDPSGTWTGRAGAFNEPLGDHVINFPAGPSFAKLTDLHSRWPAATIESRSLGGQFLGYRLDDHRRPVFRYVLEGVTISEVARPIADTRGFGLVRAFTFDRSASLLKMLAAEGRRIAKTSAGRYVVDGQVFLKLPSTLAERAVIRTSPDDASLQQLVVALPSEARSVELEVSWK
jgi:mono/diheme cytochrome c family protein